MTVYNTTNSTTAMVVTVTVIVNETGHVTGYEIGATVRGRGSRGRREVEVEGHGAGRVADVFVDAKVSVSNA